MSNAAKTAQALQAQQQTQEKTRTRDGNACRQCEAPLVPGARFCEECGASTGAPCPECGGEVGGGDFCEACGCWLKPGQCRFCYEPLYEGANFCSECGNDQRGLLCTRCGTHSLFDFCTGCGDALSETAQEMSQRLPANPELAGALQALQALQAVAEPPLGAVAAAPAAVAAGPVVAAPAVAQAQAQPAGQLAAPAAMPRHAMAPTAPAPALATAPTAPPPRLAGLGLSAQLREASERIQEALNASKDLTFENAQTARRHFMSLRMQLVRNGKPPRKWLCNYANCEHDTPNECGDPSQGGVWLFD